MKKIVLTITALLIFGVILSVANITARAGFDLQAHYEKMKAKREKEQKEMYENWLDDLEADGNLTQEAIDAAGIYGEGRTPNYKSRNSSSGSAARSGDGSTVGSGGSSSSGVGGSYSGTGKGSSSSEAGGSYGGTGKGWVYSADELHVIGLPEGENGYTKPGYYGDIDGSYSSGSSSESGKGWVYSADELHVIGLPEGEDGYTQPGWYGDIE